MGGDSGDVRAAVRCVRFYRDGDGRDGMATVRSAWRSRANAASGGSRGRGVRCVVGRYAFPVMSSFVMIRAGVLVGFFASGVSTAVYCSRLARLF